jgi:hypothetical protein
MPLGLLVVHLYRHYYDFSYYASSLHGFWDFPIKAIGGAYPASPTQKRHGDDVDHRKRA